MRSITILISFLCTAATADGAAPATTSAPAAIPKSNPPYVAAGGVVSKDATQAAAADETFVYAVSSTHVVKIDRASGKELARSTGPATHLNSAFVWQGAVYCAHSNFPKKPDQSDIRVLDPATMKLTVFHAFETPPGSLTWAIRKGNAWWCHFAHYGNDNGKSMLVRYDDKWLETGRWTYPPALVADWGNYSLSGGIWDGDDLLATGHDKRLIYRLRLPKEGTVVEAIETIATPFPGQGIANDPVTRGLVGIDRAAGKVVFARREAERH